jgi:hypothetical protein
MKGRVIGEANEPDKDKNKRVSKTSRKGLKDARMQC